MRLFVAVWPTEPAVRELDTALTAVRAEAARDAGRLRWTAPAQWHLTLAFLGEVGTDRRPNLDARLARSAARHPPVRLRLAGAARLGPGVLAAGVDGDTALLGRLAASVTAAARRCGILVDRRPYRAHLTLARSRGGADLAPLATALAGFRGQVWTASAVCLVHSRPPDGPRRPPTYQPLAEWPLTGKHPQAGR